ncbi:MAG: hypothetical protein U0791_04580 [Gemmataceae bacterium]
MHLDFLLAHAFAGFAAAALLVEAEAALVVTADFRFRQPGEQFADQIGQQVCVAGLLDSGSCRSDPDRR